MSVFEMPSRLYSTTDIVITMTYGMPCAKYRLGTHSHALRDLFSVIKLFFRAPSGNLPRRRKIKTGFRHGGNLKGPPPNWKTILHFLCGLSAPQSGRDRRIPQRPRHPARRAFWPRGACTAGRPDPEFFQVRAGRLHRFLRPAADL